MIFVQLLLMVTGSHMLCFTYLSVSITLMSSMAFLGSNMLCITQLCYSIMLLGSMVVAGSHMFCITQIGILLHSRAAWCSWAANCWVLSCSIRSHKAYRSTCPNYATLSRSPSVHSSCFCSCRLTSAFEVKHLHSFMTSRNACHPQKRERYGWNQTK